MPENVPPNDVPTVTAAEELDFCRERYAIAVSKLEAMKQRNLETLEKLKKCRARYTETAAKMEQYMTRRSETMEKLKLGSTSTTSENVESIDERDVGVVDQANNQPVPTDNQPKQE